MGRGITSAILMALMFTAALAVVLFRPIYRVADRESELDLSRTIPFSVGEWREDKQQIAMIVDPQQQATIRQIYTDTLSRTYVDSTGYRVMLSIAYGKDQSDKYQMHLPEICYPAQGFSLQDMHKAVLSIGSRLIPVMKIVARQGQRSEPLTYWTTVGSHVVQGAFQKKLAELRYSLNREIPDGLLFRVSSIDDDEERAFERQRAFIQQVLTSLDQDARVRIAGEGF